ncbi:MAG: hypothetical protein IKA57_06355 [Clostridia bacterium]|nr:hypothetical protein [Clostridia bacterium]
MGFWNSKKENNVMTFSKQVQKKLMSVGGSATIQLLNGDVCHILLDKDNTGFVCDKLNNYSLFYHFEVFDVIQELLNQKGGRALKGAGRGKEDKVGYGKCGLDTVVGYIAYKYSGVKLGASTFDPVFVLAAVLDWANIARNCRGYIELI